MMMHEAAPPPLPASTAIPGSAPPPPLSKHRRYSSRSNSFSSASVVMVNQRKGSFGSSSTAVRTSGGLPSMQSQSPGDASLLALRMGRERDEHLHRRRKSVALDPAAEQEGMTNINRWSHSTSSSVTSLTANTRRSRASSGAALASSLANHAANRTRIGLDQSPRASPQRQHISSRAASSRHRHSPPPSPTLNPPPQDLTNLHTTLSPPQIPPALTDPDDTDSPSTIRTIITPSSYSNDFFGNKETSPQASKKPGINRNHSAQGIVLTSARANGLPQEQPPPLRSIRTSDGQGHGHVSRPSGGTNENGHRRPRTREGHDRDKKMMLSKALQKANTAVLLDNAQNFEGALDAYSDACRLLQQVMDRSSAVEDKRKLEAIRMTYTNRIHELQELDMIQPSLADTKSLPARPMSDDTLEPFRSPPLISPVDAHFTASPEKIRATGLPRMPVSRNDKDDFETNSGLSMNVSSQYLRNGIHVPRDAATSGSEVPLEQMKSPATTQHLLPLDTNRYMPAPLSVSPKKSSMEDSKPEPGREDPESMDLAHGRRNSTASVSWLDTIDESGSSRVSSAQSMHSKSSQMGLRRRHLRNNSGDTDPDFDAAFDAAVEAAYDQGLEPDLEIRRKRQTAFVHAPEESLGLPMKEVASSTNSGFSRMEVDETDEEERILDEITSDYVQGFNFDLSHKSALPRQSDSSGYSRSTWQSSQASMDRTTAATSLSTVAEDGLSARLAEDTSGPPSSINTIRRDPPVPLPPAPPPPTGALPQLPNPNQSRISTVRSRRLSGQNAKQLMIETAVAPKIDSRQRASTFHHSPSEKQDNDGFPSAYEDEFRVIDAAPADTPHKRPLKSPPSLNLHSTPSELALPTFAMEGQWRRSLDEQGDLPSARPILVRAKRSSMSLKAEHMVLLASPDVENTPFIMTPMSSTFMTFASKRSQDPLNSQRAKIPAMNAGFTEGGSAVDIYLFDTSLSSPQPPSSPKSPGTVPLGLEPCPESFLLRPFWLMRSLSTTLTHPRGGYVTTRLFVPREVWQTRNAKLKLVEEKIANCDLLTAALGHLAGVDTLDADAVMDELQSFEEVMERVQTSLAKKLGSDVGVHGTSGMFKDAVTGTAPTANNSQHGPDTTSGAEKTKSKEHKGSYLSSWRKLRSKSSGAPLNSSVAVQRPTEKDLPTMPSVPMTSFMPVERRGHKRDVRNLIFDGPNKEYMASLARLFDGAQVLDQIARQVEDPGLKHSSPTHVGLELSIRHAAEFFGFYVCRFVLADLTTLMDKFVKRGSEWVLA